MDSAVLAQETLGRDSGGARAWQDLPAAAALLGELLELVDQPALVLSMRDGCVRGANGAAQRLFGRAVSLVGESYAALRAPADDGRLLAVSEALDEAGRAEINRVRLRRADGGEVEARARIRVHESEDGPLALVTLRDLAGAPVEPELERSYAELERAQARLGASEQKYQALVHAADDAILVADLDSALFVESNPAAHQLLGYSEEELRSLCGRMLHPPEELAVVRRISKEINQKGRAWHPNVRMRRRDGSLFWAEVRMAVYEQAGRGLYVTIIRDVTTRVERERELQRSYQALQDTQAKLIQTGRLSAMGQLSAGIAHELNQPITAIQGFAQRLRRLSSDRIAEHDSELEIIVRQSQRMARIVDNVRTFGRETPFHPEATPAHQPLDDALMLVSAQLRSHGIVVTRSEGAEVPSIRADSAKIQQVFLNVLMNALAALDALPEGVRRQLVIETQTEGDRVVYAFHDTGPGIPEAIAARVFDPFFSTRPTGQGTGLGLSIAYAIVAEHRGEIMCNNGPDGGASFTIRLPTAD